MPVKNPMRVPFNIVFFAKMPLPAMGRVESPTATSLEAVSLGRGEYNFSGSCVKELR